LNVWESALGFLSARTAIARFNLAALYRDQNIFAEAEWQFQRGLRIRDNCAGKPPDVLSEPLFSNVVTASKPSWRPWLGPESGLLHPVDLHDDPLAIDVPDSMEQLSAYASQVQKLRGAAGGEVLKRTIEKLGPWYHNLEIRPGLMTN